MSIKGTIKIQIIFQLSFRSSYNFSTLIIIFKIGMQASYSTAISAAVLMLLLNSTFTK
jgi:hypothetical protein